MTLQGLLWKLAVVFLLFEARMHSFADIILFNA